MALAFLQVLDGPMRGQSLLITAKTMTLGREADMPLHGYDGVSRLHARLHWNGLHFTIEDLDSTNGVSVDGKFCARATLAPNALVKLGRFSATLRVPPEGPHWPGGPAPDSPQAPSLPAPRPSATPPISPGLKRGAIAGVLGFLVLGWLATRPPSTSVPQSVPETSIQAPVQNPTATLNVSSSTAAAIRAAQDATVLIVTQSGGRMAFGSGFLVAGGVVVTNEHVVAASGAAQDCVVVLRCGTPQQTSIEIGADQIRLAPASQDDGGFRGDLATIKLPEPLPAVLPLSFGRAEAASEADEVYVTGFPLGIGTLTPGRSLPSVSVKPVRIERLQRDTDASHPVSVIQLGGTVTHGNSGGPVINAQGGVIGVISRGSDGTGMVYAIPASYVQALLGK